MMWLNKWRSSLHGLIVSGTLTGTLPLKSVYFETMNTFLVKKPCSHSVPHHCGDNAHSEVKDMGLWPCFNVPSIHSKLAFYLATNLKKLRSEIKMCKTNYY